MANPNLLGCKLSPFLLIPPPEDMGIITILVVNNIFHGGRLLPRPIHSPRLLFPKLNKCISFNLSTKVMFPKPLIILVVDKWKEHLS